MASLTFFEIPLTPNAQRFYVTLAGVQYQARVMWRAAPDGQGGWVLDFFTSAGADLILGIPLVTGLDLLAPYPDKAIGGQLFVTTEGDATAVPTYENLGSASRLYFAVPS